MLPDGDITRMWLLYPQHVYRPVQRAPTRQIHQSRSPRAAAALTSSPSRPPASAAVSTSVA